VLHWSVDAARSVADGVIAVVPADRLDDRSAAGGADCVVACGATRSASVRTGLGLVPADAAVIIVHDAARPLASPALFRAVVAAVERGDDGAIPGVPLADTVKRVDGAYVTETLDRAVLVAVQTPQAFRAAALRRAHETGLDATDDAALVEAVGLSVSVVPGEVANKKITEPADLEAMYQAALAAGAYDRDAAERL
jgi:2-C-methyl-D-erythritol 4-phosphate cytidylyltransferase